MRFQVINHLFYLERNMSSEPQAQKKLASHLEEEGKLVIVQ
jgi:hypothetical protein